MAAPSAYGRGSRRNTKEPLGRDQLIDIMRFLGYVTHDQDGRLTDEAFKTAAALAGRVVENAMLNVWIAQEYDKHRIAR